MSPSESARRPELLVSVRSAEEALAALQGGAALIDVKEPANGPLGRAGNAVIEAVVAAVSGRRPVTAAMGELADDCGELLPPGLSFVKWGLAGLGAGTAWQSALETKGSSGPEVVAVAYADWQCARAPAIDDVFALAARRRHSVLLVDTYCKDAARSLGRPPTLLDWLPATWIEGMCRRCRAEEVRIALAGCLGPAEIRQLSRAKPDWFAVRGAACEGGRRGIVSAARVRELVRVIGEW
jgi:uncharacterized protein (UPF0264 family)